MVCEVGRRLITLGGVRVIKHLEEVQAYEVERDAWGALPFLPEGTYGSVGVLLGGEALFNVRVRGADLGGQVYRDAEHLEGKIVSFGSFSEKRTFVMGREGDSLRVEKECACLGYGKGFNDDSFRAYKGRLYGFETDDSRSVFCFRLDWSGPLPVGELS